MQQQLMSLAFQPTRTDMIVTLLFMLWILLMFTKRTPEITVVRDFINIINSRGGNIVVLALFSAYFFRATMQLFYHALELLQAGQLKDSNAILLMALQFCTTSAFAGSFGAMLKTMTGADMMGGRSTDPVGGVTSRTVQTQTTSGTATPLVSPVVPAVPSIPPIPPVPAVVEPAPPPTPAA